MEGNDLRRWFRERVGGDLFLSFNLTQTGVTVIGALVLLIFMLLAAPVLRYYPLEVFVRGLMVSLLGGAVSLAYNSRHLLALRSLQQAVIGAAPLDPKTARLLARINYELPIRLLILTFILWPTMPLGLGLWFKATRVLDWEDAIRLGASGFLYAPIQALILFYFARLVLRRIGRITRRAGVALPEIIERSRFSLRSKLTLSYACLAIVPLLTGLLLNEVRREGQQMTANLESVCTALDRAHALASSQSFPDWEAAFGDDKVKRLAPAGTGFQAMNPAGYILHGELGLDARMIWNRLLKDRRDECFWRPVPGGTDFLVLRFYRDPGVWLGAETRPTPSRDSVVRRLGGALMLAMLVMGLGVLIALLAAEDVSSPVRELSRVAERASQGDYVEVSDVIPDDELGQLATGFNRLVVSVREALARSEDLIHRARGVSESLADEAGRIRELVDRNREVIDEQSSLSVEAAGGAEMVTRAAIEIKERAHHTSSQMDEASESCRVSNQTLSEVTRGMEGVITASEDLGRQMEALEENYRRMEEVVRIIDDVAERTEMLGLNAALEVGGAEGRGGRFAVVALEVQRLSERISQETSAIKSLFGDIRRSTLEMAQTIELSRSRAAETPEWIQKLSSVMKGIERRSNGASDSMREIVHMTEQQSQSLEQMKVMVSEIQSVATVMDEVSQGAENTMGKLNELAGDLRKLLN